MGFQINADLILRSTNQINFTCLRTNLTVLIKNKAVILDAEGLYRVNLNHL